MEGILLATLASVVFVLCMVGVGTNKARQPKPHQPKEQRHATTQQVVKAAMSEGEFLRLHYAFPLCSLLAPGYNPAHDGAGVLPQLQKLCHTRGDESQLWGNDAEHLSADALKAGARSLMHKISGVLMDECSVGLAPGVAALECPMMIVGTPTPMSTCMLYDGSKVKATPYFKTNNNGYLLLDFGKHKVTKSVKKRGRLGGWSEREVEEPQLILTGSKVVCWLFHGCPKGKEECGHLCGHPNCLNPRHLRWVSKTQNSLMVKWHKEGNRGKVPVEWREGGGQELRWG